MVANNVVAGEPAALESIEFGDWIPRTGSSSRMVTPRMPSGWSSGVGVEMPFRCSSTAGRDSISVSSDATAAARNLHVVMAMDITNSWNRPDYYNARDAAVASTTPWKAPTGRSTRSA